MNRHEVRGLVLFLCACAAFAYPPRQYILRSVVAGVTIDSQPMTLERCERLKKDQPNLRAACVPVVK